MLNSTTDREKALQKIQLIPWKAQNLNDLSIKEITLLLKPKVITMSQRETKLEQSVLVSLTINAEMELLWLSKSKTMRTTSP